jgi:hypothetical protein
MAQKKTWALACIGIGVLLILGSAGATGLSSVPTCGVWPSPPAGFTVLTSIPSGDVVFGPGMPGYSPGPPPGGDQPPGWIIIVTGQASWPSTGGIPQFVGVIKDSTYVVPACSVLPGWLNLGATGIIAGLGLVGFGYVSLKGKK